jgi:hypothetical protein
MNRKLSISFKMSVYTPIGREPLGAIGGDEIKSKLTSVLQSVRVRK